MIKHLLLLYLILNTSNNLSAVTHWHRTINGKIQVIIDSPFELRKPDDLLALLEQESRKDQIGELFERLSTYKTMLDEKFHLIEKNSNIELKVSSTDVDCLATDKLYKELDLYNNIALNGSERGINISIPKELSADKLKSDTELTVPYCLQFTLTKSSESLVNKTNILLKPEEALKKSFLPVKSLDDFGYYLVKSLKENATSWVHYNLASFYWRIKGDGANAIDCLKLAVQFVTQNFQDIPLHNFAGILHQSRHHKEAIQILNSAVQFAPNEPRHYLALGNIYAALEDFNNSIKYYDKYLEIEPNNKDVASNRHAVLCYHKVETALATFYNDLQNILSDLHNYHSLQQEVLRLQELLLWQTATFGYQYKSVTPRIDDVFKKIQRCSKKVLEGKPVISCQNDANLEVEKRIIDIVEKEKQKLTVLHPNNSDIKVHHLDLIEKYPTTMPTKNNQYFDATGWPKKEECAEWKLPLEEKEDLRLSVFLPPENKGYNLKKAITEDLNLPENTQHDLPWYPPICDGNGETLVHMNEKHQLDIEQRPNEYLRKEFLNYINNGNAEEHEIGQRIISAMNKQTAPKWILGTLASLYWRVRGNVRKTLDCLDMAWQNAPREHRDVVLVSLSSTLYLLGLKDQALDSATIAFKINFVEPSTNFLLGLLHYENGNPLMAIYYLKNVLRVEPDFYDGLAKELVRIWSCRIKLGIFPKAMKPNVAEKHMHWSQSTPIRGEVMVCDEGDKNCETEDVECFKTGKDIVLETPTNEPEQCTSDVRCLGDQIIAQLMAAKARDNGSPPTQHNVHMGLSLGAEHFLDEFNKVDDFYVALGVKDSSIDSDQRLHIYDRYGTYTLSPKLCKNGNLKGAFKYSQLWEFIKPNTIDISSNLKQPFTKNTKISQKPYCTPVQNPRMDYGLNEFTLKVLAIKLPNTYDKDMIELLQLICGDNTLNVRELGIKISRALAAEDGNWKVSMASAIYWIVYGNTEEAIICIRNVLAKIPKSQVDIPLIFLSHLLSNTGLPQEGLKISQLSVTVNPSNLWSHFKMGENYIKLGKFEDSVPYFRAALQLHEKFDFARIRLRAVLCKMLFDESYNHGSITTKVVDD